MKVVHVVSKDTGGAARAAIRISCALQQQGIDSKIIVLNKTVERDDIYGIFKSKFTWNAFRLIRKINDISSLKNKLQGFYNERIGVDISKLKLVKEADIINLHWINDGMLTLNDIEKLTARGKKIVWTMHDMFSFTAGCYYDNECGKYKSGCHECPLAKGNKKAELFVEKQFTTKSDTYSRLKINFVGCSKWIAASAKKSPLTKEAIVTAIGNPINTEIFKPINSDDARNMFGVTSRKKIILFGAMSSDSDLRKGFKYLQHAVKKLNPDDYLLVVFGNNSDHIWIDSRFETVEVGRINSDSKLVALYSMADVFVAPSIQENLSNAVMEALACGTPVVAFDVGGMKDMIENKKNGYLAKPYCTDDLAVGIQWSSANKAKMKNWCRKKIESDFSMNRIGKQYLALYDRVE
jgi:glycosyltransferase involved in cell wall biosynthesis